MNNSATLLETKIRVDMSRLVLAWKRLFFFFEKLPSNINKHD